MHSLLIAVACCGDAECRMPGLENQRWRRKRTVVEIPPPRQYRHRQFGVTYIPSGSYAVVRPCLRRGAAGRGNRLIYPWV